MEQIVSGGPEDREARALLVQRAGRLVMRDFEGWKEAGRRRTKGLWFLSGSKGASSVRDSYSCHSLRVAYI